MAEIRCVNGEVVQVDPENWGRLQMYTWYSSKIGVCRKEKTNGRDRTIYLHRDLLGAPPELHVGFKDGDKLNCRRTNLFAFPPGRRQEALARLESVTE